ncbi:MAG: hypothetical protein KF712_17475 [Akkermansiaceae bacterium]|nr:hypothetical protein [Akkermansiaceae bacterium]
MRFLDQMERKMGWLAFPGLFRFYALFHALVFGLQLFRKDIGMLLEFDREKILAGEVWRVLTFLFSSSGMSGIGPIGLLFFFFMVRIAFMLSDALEGAWGVFRTSMFMYAGWLFLLLGNFISPVAFSGSGFLLYGTAFLAFATLFPKVEFLMFFILPVQVRFLAMIQVGFLVLTLLADYRLFPLFLLGHLNYLLWTGIPALRGQARVMQSVQRRRSFNEKKLPKEEAFHACTTCGRTEISDPKLEFRVGTDGHEYCGDHLPD